MVRQINYFMLPIYFSDRINQSSQESFALAGWIDRI